MAAKEPTVERRHRFDAAAALNGDWAVGSPVDVWVKSGNADEIPSKECQRQLGRIALALALSEQVNFAQGLAARDERCLQSDMQRIRERLAAERAWDEGFVVGSDNQVSVTRAIDLGERMPAAPVNPYRAAKEQG